MISPAELYEIRTRHIDYDKKAVRDLCEGNVLEIGSGTGRLIDVLISSPQVHSYTGIELSNDMFNLSKKIFPDKNIILGDFIDYKFHKKYDTILFSFNVINEFTTIEMKIAALKKARSLLKNNGKIVLFMACHDFEAWGKSKKYFNWVITDDDKVSWSVSLDISRDLCNQISNCHIQYQNKNLTIEDNYQNSLMTRNELLLLFRLVKLDVKSEHQGQEINKEEKKYPELNENIVYVVKKCKKSIDTIIKNRQYCD